MSESFCWYWQYHSVKKTQSTNKYTIYVHCRKIYNLFVWALETGRKASLFRRECKLILYSTTMYVYCIYSSLSKSPKQLQNCLKIAETIIVLIVFNGVICDVSAYTVTVSFCCSTWIRYQKCFIRSMTK